MSDAPDPLEAELSALRPIEVSSGLRRGIAERLAEPPPARRPPRRLALASGLAAACLTAALLRWGGDVTIGPEPMAGRGRPAPAVVADPWPTLLAYERALARSPEELGALLEEHARLAPGRRAEPLQIGALTRSDSALHALLGDD